MPMLLCAEPEFSTSAGPGLMLVTVGSMTVRAGLDGLNGIIARLCRPGEFGTICGAPGERRLQRVNAKGKGLSCLS
jgi:hypothetical protein